MNLAALTWYEWRRRPLRMGVTAAGVAIATAALFSQLTFQQGYSSGLQSELNRLGAHVLVVPKGCPYDAASIALHGANWPCYLKEEYLSEVRAVAGVAAAAPVLMTAFYNPDGTQAVYLGIEQSILKLKPSWRIQGRLPQSQGELLIGAGLQETHGWRMGQTVPLPGCPGRSGTICGILSPTHGAEDGFFYLSLPGAQDLFSHPRELTHILVRLIDPNQLEAAVSQLRGCNAGMEMNVVPLAHLFRSIQNLVNATRIWLGCIALAAMLVALAGVANALVMAVAERTREIGVMRALGAAPGQIFGLFWMQTLQVCSIGCILGMGTAYVTARQVEAWLRTRLPFAPSDPLLTWDWKIGLGCFLGALLLGSLAAFVPAWQAARLPPREAMRSVI